MGPKKCNHHGNGNVAWARRSLEKVPGWGRWFRKGMPQGYRERVRTPNTPAHTFQIRFDILGGQTNCGRTLQNNDLVQQNCPSSLEAPYCIFFLAAGTYTWERGAETHHVHVIIGVSVLRGHKTSQLLVIKQQCLPSPNVVGGLHIGVIINLQPPRRQLRRAVNFICTTWTGLQLRDTQTP